MPEFILDHGGPKGSHLMLSLDSFAQGYIEAMFFTSTGSRDDGDLENATVVELAPDAIEQIKRDCAAFQNDAAVLLDQAYQRDYTKEQAGRDFWFTRNGHGVGYWDRKELAADDLGDKLKERCGWRTKFPEVDLYRGDDDRLYIFPG